MARSHAIPRAWAFHLNRVLPYIPASDSKEEGRMKSRIVAALLVALVLVVGAINVSLAGQRDRLRSRVARLERDLAQVVLVMSDRDALLTGRIDVLRSRLARVCREVAETEPVVAPCG